MTQPLRIGLMRAFLVVAVVLVESLPATLRAMDTETDGAPWVGPRGVEQSTADIMRRETSGLEIRGEAKVLKSRLAAATRDLPPDPESLDSSGNGFPSVPFSPKGGTPDSPIAANAQALGISFAAAISA